MLPLQFSSTIAPDGAAFRRLFDELVAVEILAAQSRRKISPRCSVRESVLIRAIIACGSPAAIERCRRIRRCERVRADPFSYSELHRMIFKGSPRDLDVVERHGVIRKLLIGLVAFARDQHDVARLGQCDGARDRLRAIRNLFVMIRAKSFFDFGDDRIGIFFPRIVRGDDAEVRILIDHRGP